MGSAQGGGRRRRRRAHKQRAARWACAAHIWAQRVPGPERIRTDAWKILVEAAHSLAAAVIGQNGDVLRGGVGGVVRPRR